MKVSDFQYELPEESIAQSAVEPRHDSRLLDSRDLSDHRFHELPDLLRPGDLVVVNETRVRSARLRGRRQGSGGKVELLLLDRRSDGLWEALARPSRRLRRGVRLVFDDLSVIVRSDPSYGMVAVELEADDDEEAVSRAGSVPLPPYFTGKLNDPSRYQTLFANLPGSAAAPTAGLHFTEDVVEGLLKRGVKMGKVDLHVSVDTFRPIATEHVEEHQMHTEWCAVPVDTASAVAWTREAGGSVVAVGTTVVRTLESFPAGNGRVKPGQTRTGLFITPGFEFSVVDALITNFHMPGSTLLVLLAAFMGTGWKTAYQTALDRRYRFLSFGDAMYAERHQT